jgi:hypothetical protein
MSVKIKDVGNYKIHVKETITQQDIWAIVFFSMFVVGFILEITFGILMLYYNAIYYLYYCFTGMVIAIISLLALKFNIFPVPAYYIDTTMYGVGGKTIRKTTPAQDHIAICQAAQEFEKEILEHVKKEKELEEIVGKCK